jgi:hypothetical protein
MKTKRLWMLGLIMALLWRPATGIASAEAPVPFKAYYPVYAAALPDPACGCMQQSFTPGGDGIASHMGLSQFHGTARIWPGDPIIQKGTGTLIAANGDTLTVYYEGTASVIDGGQHIITDGWYIVTGGSGRFEGVTGEGTYHVYVYTSGEPPNDLSFTGVLNK